MTEYNTIITVGIIAFNEHLYIQDLFDDLACQSYPKKLTEIILVDGESTDDTLQIMEAFKKQYDSEYYNISIQNNPKRIQPAGWNIVIKNATTGIILRIDAHARLDKDFLLNNVECINSGEMVCGGPRENIIDDDTNWKRMLLTAEQSMFGAGIARYRNETKEKIYVDSVFHGAYKKEVFDKVGLFNENLVRTEDNEIHYRIRKSGYRICYSPAIKSYYQTRNSLSGMIRQKFLNGYWIGKTLFVCRQCISYFHLVPFLFLLLVIVSSILIPFGIIWPSIILWAAYLIACISMAIMGAYNMEKRSGYCFLLPVVFLFLHISYGTGTLLGIIGNKK